MTTLDVGIAALRSGLTALRSAAGRFYDLYDRVGRDGQRASCRRASMRARC